MIKHLVSSEKISVKPRGSWINATSVAACAGVLCAVYVIGSAQWVLPAFCAIVTSWLSVVMFYLNSHLLKVYNVVFVSLFQLWGLIFEAMVVTSLQNRPDVIVAICSIGIVILGHYFFFKDHMEHGRDTGSPPRPPVVKASKSWSDY